MLISQIIGAFSGPADCGVARREEREEAVLNVHWSHQFKTGLNEARFIFGTASEHLARRLLLATKS